MQRRQENQQARPFRTAEKQDRARLKRHQRLVKANGINGGGQQEQGKPCKPRRFWAAAAGANGRNQITYCGEKTLLVKHECQQGRNQVTNQSFRANQRPPRSRSCAGSQTQQRQQHCPIQRKETASGSRRISKRGEAAKPGELPRNYRQRVRGRQAHHMRLHQNRPPRHSPLPARAVSW